LIAEYRRHHEKSGRKLRSIKDAGIVDMEIYLLGTRMFMIMEVNERFLSTPKPALTAQIPRSANGKNSCEFQQPLPAPSPEKSGCSWNVFSTWNRSYCSTTGGHLLMKPNPSLVVIG